MNRNAVFIAMVCAVLATPVLGVWIYEGTYSYISEPDQDSDPNGTWWCGWDGEGSVSGGPFSLQAGGWTNGYCGVALRPYAGTGLRRGIYAWSSVNAHSTYHWEGSGFRGISFTIQTALNSGSIDYSGYAIDDTHVSVVSSNARASASTGGGVSGIQYFYRGGSGAGWATTQVGSGASNDPDDDVTVIADEVDWGYPPPYLYNV